MERHMARVFKVEKAHSEIVSKGTIFKALKYIDRGEPVTPVLLVDRDKVLDKAAAIGSRIRNSRVFYAIKANPDLEIARLVSDLGLGFEIASEGELEILAGLGVQPENIITSNPVKSVSFIRAAASYGVGYFAFDSKAEVDKMATEAPGSRVYVRLAVPNEGSDWPLSKKFGVELDEALKVVLYAADRGLEPAGITFHVGSQCLNKFNWNSAIHKARELWEMAERHDVRMSMLNIGGGYPINYTKRVVGIEEIEKNIDRLVAEHFPEGTEVFIEPGRALVGDAGIFITRVIGKARRGGDNWLHIDVGVFNGLMESVGGIKYSYVAEEPTGDFRKEAYIIGGPSCDSYDVIDKDVSLPEPEVGSLLLVLSAGAYTTSYASEFNGFPIPETILI